VIKAEPRHLPIKPEPAEDRVPNRKRSGTLSILREIAPKKIKAELENPRLAGVDVKPLPSTSTEAIRGELLDLQADVNHLQPQLDRYRRKTEKTTSQLKKEMEITKQLIALHRRKKELTDMLPTAPVPAHPIPGPSYQNGGTDWFTQLMHSPAPVIPPIPTVAVSPGSKDLLAHLFKHEPMETESDRDDATPPPVSDMDSFPFEDHDNNMLVDGTNFGLEYHYGVGKADE